MVLKRSDLLGGSSIPKGTTANRPDPASIGDFYYNGTLGAQEIYTASGWVTLGAIPGSPTAVSATDVGTSRAFNNGAASVAFTAPTSGGFITGYTVVSSPGGYTATGASSPVIVEGLQSNTAYTFTVTATNSYGNSLASAPSSAITATTIPDLPSSVSAALVSNIAYGSAPGAIVSFTPNATGGKSTTYTATSSPGSFTETGASSPLTVSGLTAGTGYTFTVTATNANGTTSSSSASSSITAATLPQAPTIGTATDVGTSRAFNNGAASVTFTAGQTGGSAITGYTVTSSPGSYTGTGSSSPITVAGLQSNTAYTFTAIATNATGNSLSSAASNSITATTVPQAPTIGTATDAYNGKISVAFTAGATGGKSVTYTATSSPGSVTGTGTSPITVSGLTVGTSYTFTVTAANANGSSSASSASSSATSTSEYELLQTYSSSGSFTVPTGITKLAVVGIGSGQAGDGVQYLSTTGRKGGSSAAGFGFKDTVTSPTTVYNVNVGSTTAFGNLATTTMPANTQPTATSNVAGAITRNGQTGGAGGSSGTPGNVGTAGSNTALNIDLSVANIPVLAMAGSGGGGGGGVSVQLGSGSYNGRAAGSGGTPGGGTGGAGSGAGTSSNPYGYQGFDSSGGHGSSGSSGNTAGSGGGGGGGAGNTPHTGYSSGSGGNGGDGLIRVYGKSN